MRDRCCPGALPPCPARCPAARPAMCPCAQPCCTYFRVGSARGRALAVTAARLKAIGDELQARVQGRRLEAECQRRRQRWASAGTGLATSIVLLLAWAWFSRRRSI